MGYRVPPRVSHIEKAMIDKAQRDEIAREIGTGNIMAISGGRIYPITHGIELPVSGGYSVRITLDPIDTYTVSRVFRRGGKEFIHGSISYVYADQISELAYRASCFESYDETHWSTP